MLEFAERRGILEAEVARIPVRTEQWRKEPCEIIFIASPLLLFHFLSNLEPDKKSMLRFN